MTTPTRRAQRRLGTTLLDRRVAGIWILLALIPTLGFASGALWWSGHRLSVAQEQLDDQTHSVCESRVAARDAIREALHALADDPDEYATVDALYPPYPADECG